VELRDWLLFFHITGAILYVGGDIMLNVFVYQARRDGEVASFLRTVATSAKVITVGAVLTLLMGIGLVVADEIYGFTTGFVVVGIVVILIGGAADGTYFNRQVGAISALVEETPGSPEINARLTSIARAAVAINVMFLVAELSANNRDHAHADRGQPTGEENKPATRNGT